MGGEMGSPSESGMGGEMGSSPSPSAMTSEMGSGMGMASPGGTGSPAAGPHDAADVRFAMMMIPHHAQAVAMADLTPTRATSAGVKSLAVAVKAAQGPEITEMIGWLRGWGTPVASGAMGGVGTTGMMSSTEMADLAKLRGTAFDRAWLTMMTTHHQGAVAMARTELSAGVNPDAKTLARSIITSQTAQLTQMKSLLAHLPTHWTAAARRGTRWTPVWPATGVPGPSPRPDPRCRTSGSSAETRRSSAAGHAHRDPLGASAVGHHPRSAVPAAAIAAGEVASRQSAWPGMA